MNSNSTVLVIGGDKRLTFLAGKLAESFAKVITFEVPETDNGKEVPWQADIIVAPVPFSRDGIHVYSKGQKKISIREFCRNIRPGQILFAGNIPEEVLSEAAEKNITCYDFLKIEQVETDNALTTAEGAVAEAIALSVSNIHGSRCMVLGYGKCGKAIAKLLKGWQVDTAVAARRESVLAQAENQGFCGIFLEELETRIGEMQFIFNTIPALVLTDHLIKAMEKDAVIIDIASAPGGTDFDACRREGIKAVLSLGIPGWYSPKTSASILFHAILRLLGETEAE